MKPILYLIVISFLMNSCYIQTKGEEGKPGQQGDSPSKIKETQSKK